MMAFNDFNYYRGNLYTKNAIDENGKVKIVTADSIVYDTLSTGKVIARNLPGEILQVPVDITDTYLRTQFSKSDNRNYRDGDWEPLVALHPMGRNQRNEDDP